jgi:PAS domain S-box-containing protein
MAIPAHPPDHSRVAGRVKSDVAVRTRGRRRWSRGHRDRELVSGAVAANDAPTLESALSALADAVSRLLACEAVSIVEWDASLERGVIRAAAGDTVDLVGEQIVQGDSAAYLTAAHGETVVVRSGGVEGLSPKLAERMTEMACRIGVPILLDGIPRLTFLAGWRDEPSQAVVDAAEEAIRTLSALTQIAHRAERELASARARADLETVAAALPVPMWLEVDGRVTVNRAWSEMVGVPHGTLPDRHSFKPRDLDGTPLALHEYPSVRCRATGRAEARRMRITRPDGEELIVDIESSPLGDGAGGYRGFVGFMRDVTERHGEEVLTKHFLETLFDSLPLAVSVLDPDTREILSVNRAYTKLIGREPSEVIGQRPPFSWWDDDWRPPEEAWEDEGTVLDALFRSPDGTLLPVDVRPFTVRDEAGTIVRHVALISDLSERRRFEQQLIQSGKLAAVGELAAGVAHEINNPLFAILGLVEFLLKDAEPGSKAAERLQLVHDTGLQIREIVRALLDFARERTDEHTVLYVRDAVAETVQLVQRMSSAKGIEIVECYTGEPTPIYGSPNQIKQIVLNLLTNAQQAMPAGGTIEITVGREDDTVVARVRDTGPGIPRDILPRIFEPFFTTKRDGSGSGLGLAVSQGIAEVHGGQLLVTDSSEAGTCFELRLPVASQPAAA